MLNLPSEKKAEKICRYERKAVPLRLLFRKDGRVVDGAALEMQ